MQDLKQIEKYTKAFQKLRVDVSKGLAPHKPILLLTVIDFIEEKIFSENKIFLTPELVKQFSNNWALLVTSDRHNPTISRPFYHLKTSKFWHIIPNKGFEITINFKGISKSINNLSQAINFVKLNEDLFILLKEKEARNILRLSILEKYFPNTKENYLKNRKIDLTAIKEIENQILNDKPATYSSKIDLKNEEDVFVRGSIFKNTVPRIYAFTCCISGLQIIPFNNISFVDACHIKPFSISKNDTISNGIALSPNLHRAFDRGLVGINTNYEVIISDKFSENKSDYSIKKLQGKKIILPQDKNCYPAKENFEWHLENVFRT